MSEEQLPVPDNDEENAAPDGVLATLKDVGERLPSYAQLSVNLVSAGKMSSSQQSQILGPLGYGGGQRMIVYPPMIWLMMFGGYLIGAASRD